MRKVIEGYDDYLIDSDGFVISRRNKTDRILKNTLAVSNRSYYGVNLYDRNGKVKTMSIHRLVAKHFIPNPLCKPQINHINGIKTDNRLDNLEWVTARENVNHAFATGLSNGEHAVGNENSIKRVCSVDNDGNIIKVYKSLKEASKDTNVSISSISQCCSNKIITSGGTRWFFYDGNNNYYGTINNTRKKRKLTPLDAANIKTRYKPRCKINGGVAIAREYGVSGTTISDIFYGRNMCGDG